MAPSRLSPFVKPDRILGRMDSRILRADSADSARDSADSDSGTTDSGFFGFSLGFFYATNKNLQTLSSRANAGSKKDFSLRSK